MEFFKKNKAIEMQERMSELEIINADLTKDLLDSRRTISSFMTVKATYEDDLQKVNKKFELEVKQLKQQVEMEKKSVARKVNKELSEIGVSRFVAEEISKSDNNLSPESICKKFTDMPESQEKHLFFEANEKVISRFMKNQQ